MDDRSAFGCLNPDCPDHGNRGHGNLPVPRRSGRDPARRLLRCSTGTARFSERQGTPLFDARLPTDPVVPILAHVAEGVGPRKTGRGTGGHPDTVPRALRLAGDPAEAWPDEVVACSPGDECGPVRRAGGGRRPEAEDRRPG